jgi:hypothetical protein
LICWGAGGPGKLYGFETGRCHEFGTDKLLDSVSVLGTPVALRIAPRKELKVALRIAPVWLAVDPAETEGFLYGFGVGDAFSFARLFVNDEPNVFFPGMVFGEPCTPGIPIRGIKSCDSIFSFHMQWLNCQRWRIRSSRLKISVCRGRWDVEVENFALSL